MDYILDPAEYGPGWYVVNLSAPMPTFPMRGPYKHSETAGAIRSELELAASDEQDELWNLGIIHVVKNDAHKRRRESASAK